MASTSIWVSFLSTATQMKGGARFGINLTLFPHWPLGRGSGRHSSTLFELCLRKRSLSLTGESLMAGLTPHQYDTIATD